MNIVHAYHTCKYSPFSFISRVLNMLLCRLSEVLVSGPLEQAKLKRAFIELIVLSSSKQNILSTLR